MSGPRTTTQHDHPGQTHAEQHERRWFRNFRRRRSKGTGASGTTVADKTGPGERPRCIRLDDQDERLVGVSHARRAKVEHDVSAARPTRNKVRSNVWIAVEWRNEVSSCGARRTIPDI